jgi:hypothetical protein
MIITTYNIHLKAPFFPVVFVVKQRILCRTGPSLLSNQFMIMWSKAMGNHELGTFRTQQEAIDWAKANGHHALVARVRHLNNKKIPDDWRSA